MLTNSARLAADLADLPGVDLVLTTDPEPVLPVTAVRVIGIPDPGPEAVRAALAGPSSAGRPVHVRVIVDLSVDGRADPRTFHDLVFLAVQALAAGPLADAGSSCLGVLLGADPVAAEPTTGLYTGLFKVIALEVAACTAIVVSTDTELAAAAAQVSEESGLARALPVVHRVGGQRLVATLDREDGDPGPELPLTSESTVLAVGGGRGITAELLVELARVVRPRIVVLGSSDPQAHPRELLEMDDGEFASARVGFIRDFLARQGGSPREASAAFQRVSDARTLLANLDRMRRHSGPDRVTYLACDITDADRVATTLATLPAGGIDLLINAAGLNRSAPLATKSLAEFRRVRDLKVLGYRHLRAALTGRMPRLWINFGSLLGFTGQLGEADYASANDYLAAASVHHSARDGAAEITIGWTLWGEVGLGANELTKSYFEKSGLYSAMSTAEGRQHFLRELAMPVSRPLTIHLGAAERAAVDRLVPGLLSGPDPAGRPDVTETDVTETGPEPAEGHYAGVPVQLDEDTAVFEHVFDLQQDGYLVHHRVSGAPTLPGMFVAEIAVEAAARLADGHHLTGLRDVTFHRFLKVWQDRSAHPHRIVATVTERRPDIGRVSVRVRVLSDVVRAGRVLVRDRLHFEATAVFGATAPSAPAWQPWPEVVQEPIPDPYHVAGSPVALTGMFVSTKDTRLHPWGKRSTFDLHLDPADPVFTRFRLPAILLDGLARTGVLELVDGDLIPLAAPLSIRRLDIFEPGNDLELARRYDRVDLYAVLDGAEPGTADSVNRFAAVRPDGRVILQFQDLQWTGMGHIRAGTGEFVPAPEGTTAPVAESVR